MAKKGIKGGNWKSEVYFDPEADEHTGRCYTISDDDLRTELTELVDAKENIQNVTAYKAPLSKYQLTKLFLYHMIIVFETEEWWWSIEKNDEGITIQRSKWREAVRDRYRQGERNSGLFGISRIKKDTGRKSVNDLIDWLWGENELNNYYDISSSNCQHFGKKVFNFVAQYKTL